MQTPHEILGVSSDAAPLEVVAAYRALAQIFHPDRFAASSSRVQAEADRLMRQLNQAYAEITQGAPPVRAGPSAPRKKPSRAQPKNGSARAGSSNGKKAGAGATSGAGAGAKGGAGRGQRSRWDGVAWEAAVKERAHRAAAAAEARRARERAAVNGTAVRRPKPARYTAVHAGLGEALVTNNIPCRRCQSIQWLPDDWRAILDESVFHCSICDALLLAHRPR